MADRWPEVLAWLAVNEWRYGKAAKHFGLPPDEVRARGRAAREAGGTQPPAEPPQPQPLARAREDAPATPTGTGSPDPIQTKPMDRRAYLLARLAEVDGARLKALALERGGQTAYTNLLRAERELRAELDALDDEDDGEDLTEMPDDAFVRELRTEAELMPESHLRVFVDIYLERHRLRLERDESKLQAIGGESEEQA